MANVKISELPLLGLTGLTNNDILPIVDINTDTTSKVTMSDMKEFFLSGMTDYVEVLYNELLDMYDTGTMVPGKFYLITDFQTIYDQPDFDYINNPIVTGISRTSDVDPILVLATSPSSLSSYAYQPSYPNDKIQYDITYSATEVTGTLAKGRITERIDDNNNRTDYDHRAIKFKRYKSYTLNDILNGRIIEMNNGLVTGLNTTFSSDTAVGDIIYIAALTNDEFYEVIQINSDTEMVVAGHNYSNFTFPNGYYFWKCTSSSFTEPGSLYYFNDVPNAGNDISDGGNDMYDSGNYLNTNLVTTIPYTHTQMSSPPINISNQAPFSAFTYDGSVQSGDTYFNSGSTYFTNQYPGLFVMAAYDVDINEFYTDGDLGADGGGSLDSYDFQLSGYSVFTKLVYNAGSDPSVTHIFLVNSLDENITHEFSADTNSDYDKVMNLSAVTQMHYLLFALANGVRPTNSQIQNVVSSYINEIDENNINQTLTNLNNNFTGITNNLPENTTVFASYDYRQNNITGDTEIYREVYTFGNNTQNKNNNYIGNYTNLYLIYDDYPFMLSNNVFYGSTMINNIFQDGCFNNTFTDYMDNNRIGNLFNQNLITNNFESNIVGERFSNNYVTENFRNNRIGDSFDYNVIIGGSFYRNQIGNDFNENMITRDSFQNNEIGNQFNNNLINNEFYKNDIGNGYNNNIIWDNFYGNLIGNGFNNNEIYSDFYENIVGDIFNNWNIGTIDISYTFQRNRIGYSCNNNSIFNDFASNTIGNNFNSNVFSGNTYDNNIGNSFSDNTAAAEFQGNNIKNSVNNNNFYFNFYYNSIGNQFDGNIISGDCYSNQIGDQFTNNTINKAFYQNTIGNVFTANTINYIFYENEISGIFYNWTIGQSNDTYSFYANHIGFETSGNTIDSDFLGNTIGEGFLDNTILGTFAINTTAPGFLSNNFSGNTNNNYFLNGFVSNQIATDFYDNQVGNSFQNNQLNNLYYSNNVGGGFDSNVIYGIFSGNTIGENFSSNNISGDCYSNFIGNDFDANNIFYGFDKNEIGNRFSGNTMYFKFTENNISNEFNNWTIGTSGTIGFYTFYGNTIGTGSENNIIKNIFWYNTVGPFFTSNQIEGAFSYNTISSQCYSNNFSGTCEYNILYNQFYSNSIGNNFYGNNITGEFSDNITLNDFRLNNIKCPISSTNFSGASHVYNFYSCDIFTNSSGTPRLSYFDGTDTLVVTNITA